MRRTLGLFGADVICRMPFLTQPYLLFSDFLRQEARVHNPIAPRTSLAESPGTYTISVVRSCISLPTRHSTRLPSCVPSTDYERRCPSSASLRRHPDAARSSYTTLDAW